MQHNICVRAIFNRISKGSWNFFYFALFRLVIGPENWRHSFNQSMQNKINRDVAPRVSLDSSSLPVSLLSFHWPVLILTFTLFGRCDYFGFLFFDTLLKNCSNSFTRSRSQLHPSLILHQFRSSNNSLNVIDSRFNSLYLVICL